jgi:2-polyprenyl-6-methoxyphenol hydroxylase-like FAD-dependent oxidoreductase
MGLLDKVLPNGKQARGVSLNQDGKKVAELSLDDMGEQRTLFRYLFMYEQSKTERLLLDYLTLNCCPVYWQTSLTSFSRQAGEVAVVLNTNGEAFNLTCDWLIGADGAHSTVRKQLNIAFKGDTYQHQFYLADVSLKHTEDDNIHLFLAKHGFAAFFTMPEQKRYRIVGNLPADLNDKTDLNIEDVKPHINTIAKATIDITECHWFTTYKLHHRMAEQFRSGRCFLIGDAAHIHSPVGGQGMNTGLQDAYNLGWKLAAVVNKQVSESMLDSYTDERMPVAADLLKTTDRAFTFILSDSFWINALKKWLLPAILKRIWGSVKLRQAFFIKVSQTGISYRDSKLNLHLSHAAKIKAGDRLPYFKVFDEKTREETDLHAWCAKPGFTLIAMGYVPETELFTWARWINQYYPQMLNFYYLPPSNKNREVFDAFEITADQRKTLIVRPDTHIGFMSDVIDRGAVDNYLRSVVGCLKE